MTAVVEYIGAFMAHAMWFGMVILPLAVMIAGTGMLLYSELWRMFAAH